MTLHKLAREIEETAHQTATMVEAIAEALAILSREPPREAAQREAICRIVTALQGEDRIRQRCQSLARAARQFGSLPAGAPAADHEAIWSGLCMDELRQSPRSVRIKKPVSGEVELF